MSVFAKKPPDISYEQMWSYIKSDIRDDIKFFQYLYLLCKEYLRNKRYRLSYDQLETVSLRLSSILFKDDNLIYYNNIDEVLDRFSPSIYLDCKYEDKLEKSIQNYSIRDNLLNLLDGYCYLGRYDVTQFIHKVESFINNLPKKKFGSEYENLYISILKSIYDTLGTLDESIFDLGNVPKVSIICYNLPTPYIKYVECIVTQLIFALRDNLIKTRGEKGETIYSLHLKEWLSDEC